MYCWLGGSIITKKMMGTEKWWNYETSQFFCQKTGGMVFIPTGASWHLLCGGNDKKRGLERTPLSPVLLLSLTFSRSPLPAPRSITPAYRQLWILMTWLGAAPPPPLWSYNLLFNFMINVYFNYQRHCSGSTLERISAHLSTCVWTTERNSPSFDRPGKIGVPLQISRGWNLCLRGPQKQ